MTIVESNYKLNEFYLRAEGHATGSAEVCSAVSALMGTIAGYVQNYYDNPKKCTVKAYSFNPKTALAYFHVRGNEETRAVFEAVLIGLLQIERNYPEYIKVIQR